MRKDLDKSMDKVEFLLGKYPELRDDDKKLWIAYLNIFHDLEKMIGRDAFIILKGILYDPNTPIMESISRARRKIQEKGLHQGEKRDQRMGEERNVRKWAKET